MQSILREKLIQHALGIGRVNDVYRNESHNFVAVYFDWLDKLERDISSLRSPLGIFLQAEKTVMISTVDGFAPDFVLVEKSARKRQRVIASQSLDRVSKEIYSKIENIDHLFEQFAEQFSHAIAVLASQDAALYAQLQPNQRGVLLLWQKLGATAATLPIFNYFSAKLSSVDRDYLLSGIIQNIHGNITP